MRTELPSDESENKHPAMPGPTPPVRETFSEERVAEYLADWRDWKRQTSGRRIRCQRHHLGQRLSHFSDEEIEDVITLARIGDAGVSVSFSEAYAETKKYLEGLDFENVIFDRYYGRFGDLILEGMRLVHEHENTRRIDMPTQADDGGISEVAA